MDYVCAEIDPAKRKGLVARAVRKELDYTVRPKHVVGDLNMLPGPTHCYVSHSSVTIKEADIVTLGFSCQDISFMKEKRIPFNPKSNGTSSKTFWGSLHLVKLWQPRVVLLENTCGLLYQRKCDDGVKPIDTVKLA